MVGNSYYARRVKDDNPSAESMEKVIKMKEFQKAAIAVSDLEEVRSDNPSVIEFFKIFASMGCQLSYATAYFNLPVGKYVEDYFKEDKELAYLYTKYYMKYVDTMHRLSRENIGSDSSNRYDYVNYKAEFFSARTYLNAFKDEFIYMNPSSMKDKIDSEIGCGRELGDDF